MESVAQFLWSILVAGIILCIWVGYLHLRIWYLTRQRDRLLVDNWIIKKANADLDAGISLPEAVIMDIRRRNKL